MSEEQMPQRDDELGAAIEGLHVPARPDDFVSALLTRIVAEEEAIADAPPQGFPATQTVLRRWLDGRRVRRLLIAAAAAAALITVGTLFGVSRGPDNTLHFDPDPATAREVIESTLAATGAAESLQGVMVLGGVEDGEFREFERCTFVVNNDGDLARRQVGESSNTGALGFDRVYRVAEHRLRHLATYAQPYTVDSTTHEPDGTTTVDHREGTSVAQEWSQMAAGPPYRAVVDDMLPWVRLRAYLRQLLEGEAPDMREVTVDGRLAWELTTVQNSGNLRDDSSAAQPVTIVVDQETRLPLVYRWLYRGQESPDSLFEDSLFELRFGDYRLGDEIDDDAFKVDVPAGALMLGDEMDPGFEGLDDRSFSEIDFDDQMLMREQIGAVPGLPAWHPQGFGLADATWAARPDVTPVPRGTATLSLAYRRGLDAFYVSAEPTDRSVETAGSWTEGEERYTWRVDKSDPFGKAWGTSLEYRRQHTRGVRLHGGAFDGFVAHLVLDPSVLPHLWVQNDRYTATVSGDLSQIEMIQVAESLGAPWMKE